MTEQNYQSIAACCPQFESIVKAQGFGISLLNSDVTSTDCSVCLNWKAGKCVRLNKQ